MSDGQGTGIRDMGRAARSEGGGGAGLRRRATRCVMALVLAMAWLGPFPHQAEARSFGRVYQGVELVQVDEWHMLSWQSVRTNIKDDPGLRDMINIFRTYIKDRLAEARPDVLVGDHSVGGYPPKWEHRLVVAFHVNIVDWPYHDRDFEGYLGAVSVMLNRYGPTVSDDVETFSPIPFIARKNFDELRTAIAAALKRLADTAVISPLSATSANGDDREK